MSNDSVVIDLISIRSRNLYFNVRETISIDELMSDSDNTNLIQGYSEIQNISTFNLSEDESKWRYVFNILFGTRVIPLEERNSEEYSSQEYEPPFSITSLVELVYESDDEVKFLNEPANSAFYPLREAWPFWRDLVNSSCFRAGYHPPIKILNYPPDRPVYTNHHLQQDWPN